MSYTLTGKLVVAISSRAVFDFEEENRVFESGDERSYMAIQHSRLDSPAAPGVAHALVKKLLAFDPPDCPPQERRIEVVYTHKKHVRKPKGLPAGAVVPSQTKTVTVLADETRLRRLLASGGDGADGGD